LNGKYFQYVPFDNGNTGDDSIKRSHVTGIVPARSREPSPTPPAPLPIPHSKVISNVTHASKPLAGSSQLQRPVQNWDLSLLQPVRRNQNHETRPQKIIELVHLATVKVLVCFRGTINACRALQVGRAEFLDACKTGKSLIEGYKFQYGSNSKPLKAYEYGAHEADFTKFLETHEDRLARFIQIHTNDLKMKEDKQALEEGELPPSKPPDEAPRPPSAPALPRHEMGFMDRSTMPTKFPSPASSGIDCDLTCVLCLEAPVRIVLEPCFHCVLCEKCSTTLCTLSCPVCQTSITGKVKPNLGRLVRPRIFSAQSFM
jgi:hypothetical protein